MLGFYKKISASKKEYREQIERVRALPEDYRFVYKKIGSYIWNFAGGTGMDMLKTQYDLIDLFEAGSAEGKHVLEITGTDVASFCDRLIQDNNLWTNRFRNRLNRKINKRLYGHSSRPGKESKI